MDIWLSVASDRSIPRSKLLEPKNFSPSKIHYSIYSFKVCLLNFQQKEGRKVLFLPIIFFASGKKLRSKEKKVCEGTRMPLLLLSHCSCLRVASILFLLELIFFNLPLAEATFPRSNQFQSVRKSWSSISQAFITFHYSLQIPSDTFKYNQIPSDTFGYIW